MAEALGNKTRQKIENGEILLVGDLKATHEDYDANYAEWDFLLALYDGVREVIRLGLVERHEREPIVSYERRIKQLFGLGYTKSIIEIFQFYLFKKDAKRFIGSLAEDKIYQMFMDDSDLYGNNYDSVLMDISLYSFILGHIGILVDKAVDSEKVVKTKQQQIDNRVYPYISKYFPKAILDWEYLKDGFNRPYISFVKLLDDTKQYRIWTKDKWQVWEFPKDKDGNYMKNPGDSEQAVLVDEGENPLGLVPFVWNYNHKSRKLGIGSSDVHEVARIDLSIIRNLSQIEQIINFAAFPQMRKAKRDFKPTDSNVSQQEDEVSVEVVLEFDPEKPESKPDWLEAPVAEPIQSIIEVISKKVSEIYRAANVGGMAATEPTRTAQSGVSKKIDFQLLNTKIINKAINLENTENKILELWLRWENQWDKMKEEVRIEREKTFDIQDMTEDLDNALTAKTLVLSDKFSELLQKKTVRQMLPGISEKELGEVDKEIEEGVKKKAEDEANAEEEFMNADDDTKQIIENGMNGNNQKQNNVINIKKKEEENA